MKRTMFAMTLAIASLFTSIAVGAPGKTDVQKGKSGETGMIRVATCKDGKDYYAPTNEHRGACSGHGGVASWADGSPVKAPKSARYR